MQPGLKLYLQLPAFVIITLLALMPTSVMAASTPHSLAVVDGDKEPDTAGSIVVTIKPLYSLVAHLSEGVEQPVLLMRQAQSPHHYNMRPSERRLLADARMIIWFGPQLEPYLQKVISQQENASPHAVTVVSVMQAKNLNKLALRKKHAHDDDGHDHSKHSPADETIDPHVWLSTDNAAAISRHISAQLITHDPANASLYKNNLGLLLKKIKQTRDFIQTRLANNKQPFIAYHDAFQYFENENGLNYIDAINFDDSSGTGLKHLARIKHKIEQNNVQCLIYQAPEPAIVKRLTAQTDLHATELDPLGLNQNDDKNAWFALMHQLTDSFSECLEAQTMP